MQRRRMRENVRRLSAAIRPIDYIAPTGYLGIPLTDARCTYVRSRPNSTMRKLPHLRDHNITVFAHSVTLKVSIPPCEPWTCTPKNFARTWRRSKTDLLRVCTSSTWIRDSHFFFFYNFLPASDSHKNSMFDIKNRCI